MFNSIKKTGFIFKLAVLVFLIHTTAFANDKITIRVATIHPVTHIITEDGFKQYAKEITKRTNGKVQFQWYLGGTLVKWKQGNDALKTGLVDMVLPLDTNMYFNEYPITKAFGLPCMFDSAVHLSQTFYKMYMTTPELRKEFEHIKPLGFLATSISQLHAIKTPPKSLDDFKNMRILGFSKIAMELCDLMGASVRQMPVPDAYMALQRKLADAIYFPFAPLKSFKLTDILSAHSTGITIGAPMMYAMNMKKWNSLPPDVQKVFEEMTESAGLQAATVLTNRGKWTEQELKKRGDRFYKFTPGQIAEAKEKLQPMYQRYIDELNAKGLDGQAIFEKVKRYSEETRNSQVQPDSWWGKAGKAE